MGDKRKREEATGADQQKPKRAKNKAKYLQKGNKGRKRAATQLMNGANAIPVQERLRDVPEDAEDATPAAEAAESKPTGDDFFVIDATPMNPAEVAEKKKSKGQIKRERQAEKETRTGEKRKEIKEGSDKKKEKKQKKEMKQQDEGRKKKEKKEREEESDSDSSSDSSSSGSESEVEVKKPTPKAADKKSEKKEKPAAKEAKQEDQATNKNRFIVFVGNLPYTATTESVTAHFSKISPISVRVATDKKDNNKKCRGFGFVEFEAFDRMQTCLKLYHHSSFDDGKSPARKINVELTAGGGGKSATRRTKLQEKNQKLAEERAKNAQDEKKKKGEKDPKQEHYSGIHPSRLNQMQ
ncbi:hypothetical protein EYB26_008973 [Talaromyces marneffei]|uniref:Putative RNA-binding protein n=1 Tax=Talaromyces marneffei PM1 TaxID=1077442 RepID=A0A093VAA3_TALMA|nr:uncharacterized protein EYB26_008973 [Talaromyces marneffei]QGA21263.1 hypothetical protein EYB26_008973 [Talaromyces marneffei]